jgi:hypothetical protein
MLAQRPMRKCKTAVTMKMAVVIVFRSHSLPRHLTRFIRPGELAYGIFVFFVQNGQETESTFSCYEIGQKV